MNFLAPWALAVGASAAIVTAVLHLIAWERPPALPFPTARFVPDGEARAASWSRRPADPPLLALRMLAVLLAAMAFAQPVRTPTRRADARLFLVDRSRAVGAPRAAHDSVAARFRPRDQVVVFDSTARAGDTTLAALAPTSARGSLSAGLVAALGSARAMARGADRSSLVVVSALAAEEVDAATATVRARWPGPVRLIALPRASVDSARVQIAVVGATADDPLRVALALAAPPIRGAPTRTVRVTRADRLDHADSVAARAGVVLWWPRLPDEGRAEGAVSGSGAVVVARLRRPSGPTPAGTAVARWLDGTPAAAERAVAAGCVREVRLPVPVAGDLVLSPAFVALVGELVAPCGGRRDFAAASPAALAAPSVVATLTDDGIRRSTLAPWLLGAALGLLLLEPLARRARRADLAADVVAPSRRAA